MRKWSVVALMCAALMIPALARAQASGTRAAGPCLGKAGSNRYVDCGNGTVTDNVTGLIWLKQADCLGSADWASASQAAAALKSGDCSSTASRRPVAPCSICVLHEKPSATTSVSAAASRTFGNSARSPHACETS